MNTKNSEALYQSALNFMPGGVNSPVRACKNVGKTPLFIERAEGDKIIDADGNEYIDYVCSWGPNILGHGRKEIIEAVKHSCDNGLTFGACHRGEIALAEIIQRNIPSMEMLRLVNSGTEAVMSAVRAARGYTGRDKSSNLKAVITVILTVCLSGQVQDFLQERFLTVQAYRRGIQKIRFLPSIIMNRV